jgi:hypothetical protein
VQGCDASILIAPTAKAGDAAAARPAAVERDMEENRNLPQYGFDTVEMAKAAVERKCPGVVTCADVLALAARDFVQLVSTLTPPANYIFFLGKGHELFDYSSTHFRRAEIGKGNASTGQIVSSRSQPPKLVCVQGPEHSRRAAGM